MPSTKYEGLSYPTLFLKCMGSNLRNNCLKDRATTFARQNDYYALFATNKANKIHSIGILSSCSDTIHSHSIKQNRNKKYHRNVTNAELL